MLGVSKLEDLIGRTDLLEILPGFTDKQRNLDLSPLLAAGDAKETEAQYCQIESNEPFDKGVLAEQMVAKILPSINSKSRGEFEFDVTNCDRSIGARLSGEIA